MCASRRQNATTTTTTTPAMYAPSIHRAPARPHIFTHASTSSAAAAARKPTAAMRATHASASNVGRREAMGKLSAATMMVMRGGSAATMTTPGAANAFTRAPPGFTNYSDSIDGYAFTRPSDWIEVKGSGNDVFYRDPSEVEANCFVGISSPSSSSYKSVRDLGTPEEAAKKVLTQYLLELTSTRLGVRRESEILDARERVDVDGKPFYDVKIRISSYSARNQYGLTPEDRPQTLEWDRTLRSALGTENGKLYELRLQVPTESYARDEATFNTMVDSFRQFEADTPSVRSGFGL